MTGTTSDLQAIVSLVGRLPCALRTTSLKIRKDRDPWWWFGFEELRLACSFDAMVREAKEESPQIVVSGAANPSKPELQAPRLRLRRLFLAIIVKRIRHPDKRLSS